MPIYRQAKIQKTETLRVAERRVFNKMKPILLALLAILFLPVSGFCDELSSKQMKTLQTINNKIVVVQELSDRNIITPEQATAGKNLFCQDAQQVVGHAVTPEALQALVSSAEQTAGLGTFWSIVIVLAGMITMVAVLALIGYYLRNLLAVIPATGYEALAYLATGVVALGGYFWRPFQVGPVLVEPLWFVVPAAFALMGCIFVTRWLHFPAKHREPGVYVGPGLINFSTVMFGVCAVAWAGLAVLYGNIYPAAGIPYFLGFCAVFALQAALGFSVITLPGCLAFGWTDGRQMPKSVFSSFIILAAYLVLKLNGHMVGDLALFETGAVFMGAFVYYLGLLIMSSKFYESGGNYGLLQVITIASGMAAFYLGSVFHLGTLLGIGGTFFVIYLLEKYYEIPWKGIGWAWSLLGVAGFLYFVVGFAKTHSQYFLWTMGG